MKASAYRKIIPIIVAPKKGNVFEFYLKASVYHDIVKIMEQKKILFEANVFLIDVF